MENKCKNCIARNMCEDVTGSCQEAIGYANTIYNRALGDLRNELKNHYTEYNINSVLGDTDYYSYSTACNYLEDYIDEMTEELKRGRENESSN